MTDFLTTHGEMPISEAGHLESQWPGLSMAEAYHSPIRFSGWADDYARDRGYPDARAYHEALTEHIRENGITNAVGLGPAYEARFPASVVNGMHRYFAAVDAGLATIPAGPNRIAPMPLVEGWDYDADAEAG